MVPSLRFPFRVLALVLLAGGLNLLSLELPGGVLFFFGAFASMPLVLALPAPWAVLAATVPAALTIPMLAHPFVMILAALEAAWLVAGRRWRQRSHLLLDLAFWAVAGGPLIYFFTHHVAGFTADVALIIAVKMVLNQSLAVAVGSFLVRHSRLTSGWDNDARQRVRVREAVFRFVVLLAAVPLVLVGLSVSAFVRVYLERVDREVLFESAQRVARQMDLFLQTHEAAVTAIAGTLSRRGGEATVLLEEARRTHPGFITMLVADADGQIQAAAADTPVAGLRTQSVADREYFRKARELDRPFVSGVFRGRGFGNDMIVAISAPVRGANGKFAGIVQASLEVHKFAILVAEESELDDALLVLVDSGGRVIHADVGAGVPIFAQLKHYTQGLLLEPERLGQRVEFDHQYPRGSPDREVGFAAGSAHGIVVIAHRPLMSGLASLIWLVGLIAMIAVGIALVAMLVARAARNRVAWPLETFARAASRQAALRNVEPIENPTNDAPQEIAMVFNAFNNLAVKLNGTYMLLRQQNEELDRRVVERTQELETARAEAVAASESKSTFLAMTSHEIRTPLNAIIGLAEALREKATDEATAARLLTIRIAGQRLVAVVNDLLDLSKVEAGKLELRPAPCDLVAMAEEIRRLFALRVEQQGLRLAVELPGAGALWVQTDGARLQQVLINLVGNALKFTKTGGISLRIEAVPTETPTVKLRCAVVDTGPGISEAEQAKLFQPYVQLSGSTTSNVRGTGLGLSISRRLVTLLGGTLGVRSRLGEGSEFHFELDVPVCAAPPEVVVAPTPSVRRVRVLAADDNAANREVLGSILETRCERLELVDSAGAALARLAQETFDVALVDLDMPDADGFSVARTVRGWTGTEASRGCRLVAFSAYQREQIWSRCAEAGFEDFVEKPVNRKELLRVLGAGRRPPE